MPGLSHLGIAFGEIPTPRLAPVRARSASFATKFQMRIKPVRIRLADVTLSVVMAGQTRAVLVANKFGIARLNLEQADKARGEKKAYSKKRSYN